MNSQLTRMILAHVSIVLSIQNKIYNRIAKVGLLYLYFIYLKRIKI